MVISIIVGTLLGALAGLGVGGGSLLMLWLTTVIGVEPAVARGINLMFFIAAAGTVSLLRRRKGKAQLEGVIPAGISGCVAAAICSLISQKIHTELLQTFLGMLFVITGIRELFYRPTKAK